MPKTEHNDSTAEFPSRASGTVCERCGRPDSVEIEGHHLCIECYQIAGSCCLEFGADDLWEEDDA
jgi:hypothetical protein